MLSPFLGFWSCQAQKELRKLEVCSVDLSRPLRRGSTGFPRTLIRGLTAHILHGRSSYRARRYIAELSLKDK